MPVAERSALRILAGEADGRPFGEQRRKRERLRQTPIRFAIFHERLVAPLELANQFGMDREIRWHDDQLVVPAEEPFPLDGRFDRGRRRAGAVLQRNRLLAPLAALDLLVRFAHARSRRSDECIHLFDRHDALRDQFLRVKLANGRVRLDPLVHLGLRVRRLVGFVVTEAPVPDQVDDRVVAEAAPEIDRKVDGRHARIHIVGVDVDDRNVEALREIRGVARRAAVAWIGRVADLIVGDQVNRSAGRVAHEALQVENLGHHALCAEGGVAVHEDRGGATDFECCLGRVVVGLQRARATFDHAVDRFEMARIRSQFNRDLPLVERVVDAAGAVMILDVAGRAGIFAALAARVGGVEFDEQFFVGTIDHVRDRREPPAVGHSDHDRSDAVGGEVGRDLLHHRDHDVEAFDREGLLADVRLAQVPLEGLDLRQAPEVIARAFGRHRNEVRPGLDVVAQPFALLDVGDVLDLVGDRRTIGAAQLVHDVREAASFEFRAQHRRRNRRHDRRRQGIAVNVERRIARRLRSERIERRGEVAVAPVRGDDRHPGRDRAQQFVGIRFEFARRRGRLLRDRNRRGRLCGALRRLDGAARTQTEIREDFFVEAVAAVQQLVDAFEEFARLRALDHAMIVGAGQRHDLLDAELFERRFVRALETRRVADRAGGDDRALARHQARHRRDRSDSAGVGQRERRPDQIVGGELIVACFADKILVPRAELREVEGRGVLDHRDDQGARSVLALRVDGESEVDSGFDAIRRRAVAAKRRDDRRVGFGGAHQRKRDEMRERDLFAAIRRFERSVQFDALRVERPNLKRPKTRRRRNREALLHVADERGGRPLQRRKLTLGREGRERRRGRCWGAIGCRRAGAVFGV